MKKEEQIKLCRKIAIERGLRNYDLFVNFFTKRFKSMDGHYIAEWVERFKSGNPVCYMDGESKKIYIDLIK